MRQLTLDLQITSSDSLSRENFLLIDENSAAFSFLEKFFSQKEFSQSQLSSLILSGDRYCGKTHLLTIFAEKFFAEFLQITKIRRENLSQIFTKNRFYILENFNEIKEEELLLHIINSAFEAKSFLVLSKNNKVNFKLRDLNSRLKNIFTTKIANPSQKSVEMLLISGFARKQIKISQQAINFISKNISRNYSDIFAAIELIEQYFQDNLKALTLDKVDKILKKK